MSDLHDISIEFRARAAELGLLSTRDERMDALKVLFNELEARRDPNWVLIGLKGSMGRAMRAAALPAAE